MQWYQQCVNYVQLPWVGTGPQAPVFYLSRIWLFCCYIHITLNTASEASLFIVINSLSRVTCICLSSLRIICSDNGLSPGRLQTIIWTNAGILSHQSHDCLLNRLFRRRSKKTSKLRATGLCVGNSPVTGEFPAQRASNAENISIWGRHHVIQENLFENLVKKAATLSRSRYVKYSLCLG